MNELIPVNNPHDAYFKATFGKIDFAKDFLNNYLPQELTQTRGRISVWELIHNTDIERIYC